MVCGTIQKFGFLSIFWRRRKKPTKIQFWFNGDKIFPLNLLYIYNKFTQTKFDTYFLPFIFLLSQLDVCVCVCVLVNSVHLANMQMHSNWRMEKKDQLAEKSKNKQTNQMNDWGPAGKRKIFLGHSKSSKMNCIDDELSKKKNGQALSVCWMGMGEWKGEGSKNRPGMVAVPNTNTIHI